MLSGVIYLTFILPLSTKRYGILKENSKKSHLLVSEVIQILVQIIPRELVIETLLGLKQNGHKDNSQRNSHEHSSKVF